MGRSPESCGPLRTPARSSGEEGPEGRSGDVPDVVDQPRSLHWEEDDMDALLLGFRAREGDGDRRDTARQSHLPNLEGRRVLLRVGERVAIDGRGLIRC